MTTGVRNVRAVLVVQGAFAISAVIVSVGVAAYPPSTMLLLWAVAVVGLGGVVYLAVKRPAWTVRPELRGLDRTRRRVVVRASARGDGLHDPRLAGVAAQYAHGMRRGALRLAAMAAMYGGRGAYMAEPPRDPRRLHSFQAARYQTFWARWDVWVALAVAALSLMHAHRLGRAEASNDAVRRGSFAVAPRGVE